MKELYKLAWQSTYRANRIHLNRAVDVALGIVIGGLLFILLIGLIGCSHATCAYESGHVACIDWRD